MTGDLILYEMLLRGLAVGALAATIIGWRRGGASRDALIAGALFLASVAGFALNSAPPLKAVQGQIPLLVLLACITPGALWLFCAVLFEDRRVSLATLTPTLVLAAVTATALLIAPPYCDRLFVLGDVIRAGICLALLAVLWRGWRGDLVEPRRRLRGPLLAIVALYSILQSWLSFSANLGAPIHGYGLDNSFAGAVILAILCLAGSAAFLQAPPTLFTPLMQDAELWRREGLTIGDVAREVAVPEHRLRRLINAHLGHRNFAAFLNARRIEAAKAFLSAASSTAISSLAFDLGYASLGPFNRAFKDATGLTPTEFRRQTTGEVSPIS